MLDERGIPVILKFEIPEKELVCEGQIGGNQSATGFSTIHIVEDPHTLPSGFLQNLGITTEKAVQDAHEGKIQFYSVPRKYFQFLQSAD